MNSLKRVSKKAGLVPGSLVHVGEKKSEEVMITSMTFNPEGYEEKEIKDVSQILPAKNNDVIWINVDGLHDTKIIGKVGEIFEIHPLVLEDVLNTNQRPKLDDHESTVYIVLRALSFDSRENKVNSEQVSFVLGKNFVLSFQEQKNDLFNPIKERIRTGKGRVRKNSADYLLYVLLDVLIDNYFKVLEKIGERIEDSEEELTNDLSPKTLHDIYDLKRELISLRKSVWPLREVISKLEKKDILLFENKTEIYLKDLYDHTVQIIDTIESFRDVVSGMLDLYLSSVSNKMNEIMKVLTIISTIFIPLTFIVGVYGMNFDVLPELHWKYGYFAVLSLMFLIAGGMILFFRRKKWL